jgi:hypothetical protein
MITAIQNGFIFVSWIAIGWIIGAVVTAVALNSTRNK